MRRCGSAALLARLLAGAAWGAPGGPPGDVGLDQKLGAVLPLAARLRDAAGRPTTLGHAFGDRPVLLVLGYWECPHLCGL